MKTTHSESTEVILNTAIDRNRICAVCVSRFNAYVIHQKLTNTEHLITLKLC